MALRLNLGELDEALRAVELESTDNPEHCRLAVELLKVSATRELADAIERLARAVEAHEPRED